MKRYLKNFDLTEIKSVYYDVIIIGSGIAGVYTALSIPEDKKILIVTKETLDISNSALAQGGIAVSLGNEDSPELHFKDTIYAGAGLCDEETVWVLVNEAAENVKNISNYGVQFDKGNNKQFSLSKEAAHSKNRIIHAGDSTGKEVCDKLIAQMIKRKNIFIKERNFVIDIIEKDRQIKGVLCFEEDTGETVFLKSHIVICATGGFGQIYKYTTNPEVATGDGAAMAFRAGIPLRDMEFVQFHPTVLYHKENRSFLISEAVRGEGAFLKNSRGEKFMSNYHELAELAPRDVVSRAIFSEMSRLNDTNVFLDITHKDKEWLFTRFPNISRTCLKYGIDISKDFIPVAPAEHYCMGGIECDIYGRTNIEGFFVCGEAACNGIHGANRLASNSLLEGLVFGNKIGKEAVDILEKKKNDQINETQFNIKNYFKKVQHSKNDADIFVLKEEIRDIMSLKAGICRDKIILSEAMTRLLEIKAVLSDLSNETVSHFELHNILTLSIIVVKAALTREESRGAHFRNDYPEKNDNLWKRSLNIGREDFNEEEIC